MARKVRKFIDPAFIRRVAKIQSIAGGLTLILSGIVLFALPAKVFYLLFLIGAFMFIPAILITFKIVTERTARSWVNYLVVYWFLKNKS